jgi:dTDP-4-amino-4,6-dideoxygalactose transaminase
MIKKYRLPYTTEDIEFFHKHSKKILQRGYLTDGGEYVSKLEDSWSEYVGSKYCAAVNSCTTALELILKTIGVEGKSVIVPNYTFYASPLSVLNAGGRVVYSDINPNTLSLDVESIAGKVRKDTKAVMIVHVGGFITEEIFKIKKYCEENNLYLIEDAACAHGSEINGKKAGTIGDISAFSFHHSKVLTSGEGGLITTDNKEWVDKIKKMRSIGLDRTVNNWEVFELGNNYKMTEITAALGILHINKAEEIIGERRKIAEFYNRNIRFNSKFRIMGTECLSSYYKYIAFTDENTKKELTKFLLNNGVELPPTVYEYLCSRQSINHKTNTINIEDSFPNAEKAMKSNICLPMYNGLTKKELSKIVDLINEFIEK